jgi:hypothetical protein
MKKNGYSSIGSSIEEQNQAIPPQEASSRPSVTSKNTVVLMVAIGIACLLTFTCSLHHRANGAGIHNEAESPVVSSATVRDCSLKECFAAGCDTNEAPFLCKANQGGCSALPWAKDICDNQCSLKICDSYTIPDSAKSCEGVDCGVEWCKDRQRCGKANPYQCLVGTARFGCSSDALSWTIKSGDNMCSKCCDARTCFYHA